MKQSSASPKRWYAAVPLAAALVVSGLVVVPGATPAGAGDPAEAGTDQVVEVEEAYGKLPMSFAVNQGQADPNVKFLAAGRGYSLALTATEAVLSVDASGQSSEGGAVVRPEVRNGQDGTVMRMRLDGAKPNPAVVGLDQLPGVANYLIGADASQWHTDVPTYAKVAHRQVYPGVDVVWYGHEGRLEHDFVVAPGADPTLIKVAFEGVDRLDLTGDTLEVHLPGGAILTERIPGIYQTVGGERRPVDGQFRLLAGNRVGFDVERYDRTRPLVIDPVLDYSTYLGGSGSDFSSDLADDIAVDAAGAAYLTGFTAAPSFPITPDAYQTNVGGAPACFENASCNFDAFVTKLDPTGTTIIYSTYLGGSGSERCCSAAIAVDATGAAYVTGATDSTDFPTTAGAFQLTSGGDSDAFLSKLDPTGTTLVYSTYLGGSLAEFGNDIAVDGSAAYVTGSTNSADFPTTPGTFQSDLAGDSEAFVAKLDTTASGAASLVYSTYFGLGSTDTGNGIAVDASGNAYVTGRVQIFGGDFPTQNPIASACVGTCGTIDSRDAFVAKLTSTGTALVYSTLLGGSEFDEGAAIAVDTSGAAYVTGSTESTDFPTLNAFQGSFGGSIVGITAVDAFVVKIDPLGSALVYSTYLGGSGQDDGLGIAVERGCAAACSAYLTGQTFFSSDFPTQGAFQATSSSSSEAFVTKLGPGGNALLYSTYLGGNDSEFVGGIAVDASGAAYVAGSTSSQDFPTRDAIQGSFNLGGDFDAFVTKFAPGGGELVYSTYLGGFVGEDVGLDIAVDVTGAAYVTGVTGSVDFPTTPGSLRETTAGNMDAFVSKLNPAGTALLYSTYLGGRGDDEGESIAVDDAGNAYVTGTTGSPDFPATAGSFQDTSPGSIDGFAVKLDAAGALVYSTFLGGSDFDLGNSIAIDETGAAYIAGTTRSVDLPTTGGAVQESIAGDLDAFVAKLDPDGSSADYVTYLGGSGFEEGRSIAVNADGAAYLAGFTISTDYPMTAGAFQPTKAGGFDVYVSKLNPTGSTLVYSTYLGGTGQDDVFGAHSIAVDTDGAAYVAGTTGSEDLPTTTGAFDRTINDTNPFNPDAFVTKLNATGTALVYSTYLGGEAFDFGDGIAVDAGGSAYVTGTTGSLITFPRRGAIEGVANPGGSFDVFVTRFSPAGDTPVSSVLLGGGGDDEGISIAVDPAGGVYVTGSTESVDFPTTPGAPQAATGGGTDAFVFKMAAPTGVSVFISDSPAGVFVGQDLTYTVDVRNLGPDPAPAGVLGVTLAFAPSFVSDPLCDAESVLSFVVTCDVPGLAPGETYTVQVTIVPTEVGTGTIVATAEIFIDVSGDDPTDNISSAQTATFHSGLGVFMADNPDPVPVGEPLTYTTDVFNFGPDQTPITTLEVTLPYPPTSVSDPLCVAAGSLLTCDVPSLAPGELYTVGATVVPPEVGIAVASARIFATAPNEPSDDLAVERTGVVAELLPDAPDLPPGLQLEGSGPLPFIAAEHHSVEDVDLYRICVTGDTFSATTVGGSHFDTQLFLFNDDGTGKAANDDDLTSDTQQSTIAGPVYDNGDPLTFTPGPYLLAVSAAFVDPLDSQANPIFEGGRGLEAPLAAAGSLASWSPPAGAATGPYIIVLTGATFIGEAPCGEPPPDEAPDLPPGQALEGTGPLTSITGITNDGDDVDLYRICVTGDDLSASTVGTEFDTQLFLFDDAGAGIAANDDDFVFLVAQSRIAGPTYTNGDPLIFTPGPHLLAISSYNNQPLDGQANRIFGDVAFSSDLVPAIPTAGALEAWSGEGVFFGPYTITLTGATFIGEAPCLEADVEVTKADDEPVAVGETLTYTLTVTNHGPSDATDVVVSDPLPAGVTLLSATPSQGTCQATACLLGTLADGATATVTIAVRADVAGTITNTATVAATEPDPVPGNNTATETTVVQAVPPVGTGTLTVSVVGGDPDFILDGPFDADFTLDPGESRTFEDIPAGVYTLAMTGLEDGLVVDAISCGAATLSVDLGARRVVFEIGAGDTVTCRFTVSDVDDDDGGYDDDPGGPGFGFDSPFDDAGQTGPSPTGDPTLAGVLAVTNTETSGGGPQGGAVQGDVAGQPAVGPVTVGELPRTGNDLLPIGLAAAFLLTGRTLSALSRRRRTQAA